MTNLADTSGGMDPRSTSAPTHWEPVKAFAVFLVIQIVLVLGDVTPFFDGSLVDPDAYMRLNRVLYLWDGGTWFDPVYPRIGPPDGHIQHWTRPMDLLLLAGALLAAPFVGFEAGLHWWGVLIGPFMLLPALIILVWSAKPLVRRESLWLVGVLFVTQLGVLMTFLVGRSDHNPLLILLFILYLGLTIRLLIDPGQRRLAMLAGAVAALALWVSVETLLFVVAGIAAPGIAWALGDQRISRAMIPHAGALIATLSAVLVIERGFGRLFDVEFDQTSIAHLVLFGLNLAFWAAIEGGRRFIGRLSDWPVRIVLAGTLSLAVMGLLWILMPGFFQSPLSQVDDLYRTVRLEHISEIQPILHWSDLWGDDPLPAIGNLFLWLGAAALAVPALVWMMCTRPMDERRGWIAVATVAAIFVPLACMQVRWVAYAGTSLVIPYAVAIGFALDRINRWRLPEKLIALPRSVVVSLACVWTFGPVALASGLATEEPAAESVAETGGLCPLNDLSAFLSDPDGFGDRQRRIMAFVDFGPELLYRTPHAVYSIPNHRHQPGFAATYRVMTADDTVAAGDLIHQNRVELIVVCPNWSAEADFYGGDTGNADGFYNALASGAVPDFVETIRLPDDLGRHFRVYSVRRR